MNVVPVRTAEISLVMHIAMAKAQADISVKVANVIYHTLCPLGLGVINHIATWTSVHACMYNVYLFVTRSVIVIFRS